MGALNRRSIVVELLDEYRSILLSGGVTVDASEDLVITSEDVLIVVDMQNDFVPSSDSPEGGRFGVAEGGYASRTVVDLISLFSSRQSRIVATRDYHPVDHISFTNRGGPFSLHCVQGSVGSEFFAPVAECLHRARRSCPDRVHVVFKGFSEDVDSFGAFPYSLSEASDRLSHGGEPLSCSLAWTGSFELKASNLCENVNSPPDVLSVLRRKSLEDVILVNSRGSASSEKPRLFICGLALDFCVLDTAVNASSSDFDKVFIVLDGCRAAHIPGVGQVGSGFLTSAEIIRSKQLAHPFSFVESSHLH